MFFKKFKKLIYLLLLAYFIIPQSVLAYSDKIIASGENVGITLNANGVLIVGTYEINNEHPAQNAGLKKGDIIKKINDQVVFTIKDMADIINETNTDQINIEYERKNQIKQTKLKLYKDESNIYKTGLFVKDSITGIGTLTFIDPKTKKFGALGHEIQEQSTEKIFEIKDGTIFNSSVTGIIPSRNGNPGEKKAEYDKNKIKGIAEENTTQGIFGTYTDEINEIKTYEVARPDEITPGPAKIITVLKNHETKEYDINIIQINSEKKKNKNFIFEITDKELINKTNGIIQGMSGSPIIRDNMILGAITHVVISDPHKGYGIFITNMLEEAEN